MVRLPVAFASLLTASFAATAFAQYAPPPAPTYSPPPPPTYSPPPQYAPPQYAPPQYAPPQYGQPQPYYQAPPELPYKSGNQIPPGYHTEERARKGLTIAGGAVFGAFYFPSFLIGASTTQPYLRWLMVPVAGPWIAMGERPRCRTDDGLECVGSFFGNVLLAFDGIAQLTGATLLTIGFAAPKTVLIRDDLRETSRRPQWQLRPVPVGTNGFGVALGGEIL